VTNIHIDYKKYLMNSDHISFEEMENIHSSIFLDVTNSDRDFEELWNNVVYSAIKYTRIRAEWNNLSGEQKMKTGSQRTNCHNTLLSAFISLERYMNWKKLNTCWTKQLFLQDFIEPRTIKDIDSRRERIGDFGNYLTFIYALNGR